MNLALLAQALGGRGWDVRIWAGAGGQPGEGRESQDHAQGGPQGSVKGTVNVGVDMRPIATGRKRRFITSLLVHLRFLRGCAYPHYARVWGDRPKPQWVCANMAWPAGPAAMSLARHLGAAYAIWHHGSDVHGGKAAGASWWQRIMLRRLWRGCDAPLFVSASLRDMAASYGDLPKSALVPSMLDPCLAQAARQRHETKTEKQGYWLFLGRFEPVKAPHLAIAAIGLAQRRGHRLKLRMVGQGSLHDGLRRQIETLQLQDAVTLEEPVDHAGLPDLFASALGLVLPSRAEGMSLTALEAAAFGLPIVAAQAPGLRDAVRHGETGLLFKADDANSLADRLVELQTRPEWRVQLGEAARAQALARTPDAAASAFAKALADAQVDAFAKPGYSKKVVA